MTRTVLIVESDGDQGAAVAAICAGGAFAVDVVPHELALAHISKHAARYDAIIVRVAAEPSTLSAADRMGEFVLRYVAQAQPDLLPRTVIVTSLASEERARFPLVRDVVDDPFDAGTLLAAVARCLDS